MSLLPKDDTSAPQDKQVDRPGKIRKYRKQFLSKARARRFRTGEERWEEEMVEDNGCHTPETVTSICLDYFAFHDII